MSQRSHRTDPGRPPRIQREKRAVAAAQVREVRERLAQGSTIKPEFEYELMSLFVRNELGTLVTIPLLAVIFSLASMFWAPAGEAMIWLSAVLLAKFLLLVSCRRFQGLTQAEVQIPVWRRRSIDGPT